jgi:hypothetical protein
MASRKRKKSQLRQSPSRDEFQALMDVMIQTVGTAPHVVTAIFGAAMLEHELESQIRERMKHQDDETWSKLTDKGRPISNLYSKIVLGHALGIYDEVFRDNLHICSKIRNDFAHAKKLVTFEHEEIAAKMKNVQLPAAKRSQLYKSLARVKKLSDGCQASYANLCLILSTELISRNTIRKKASLRSRVRRATDGIARRAKDRISPLAVVLAHQQQNPFFAAILAHQQGSGRTPLALKTAAGNPRRGGLLGGSLVGGRTSGGLLGEAAVPDDKKDK